MSDINSLSKVEFFLALKKPKFTSIFGIYQLCAFRQATEPL